MNRNIQDVLVTFKKKFSINISQKDKKSKVIDPMLC